MIECQAKQKWCPFVQARREETKGEYVAGAWVDQSTTRCIGSDCMAWRYDYDEISFDGDGDSVFGGYCGLAGKL